jgi:ribosomal protein S18 acetylase RimI-like enzyme
MTAAGPPPWSAREREPVVRVAGAEHAPAISDLLYQFNGEALNPDELARRMEEAQDLEIAFLGQLDGVVAGILVLRTGPTLSGAEDWAAITELFVQPAFRRRGLGRAMVEAAVEYSQSQGCNEIHLLVDPANEGALAFYETVGFRQDAWDMRRRI